MAPCLPAGAPPANGTFFCDAATMHCYLYLTTLMAQANATAYCSAVGGHLVAYRSASQQLMVEVRTGGTWRCCDVLCTVCSTRMFAV
jgi:hypothetical protein